VAWCRELERPTTAASEAGSLDPASTLEARCYQTLRRLATTHVSEIERRFPKVIRRVGGYNLDEFVEGRPINLAKMFVGSEGTLGIVLEAKLKLVPLPAAKVLLVIQFDDLLDALGATPSILRHGPSAVEAMDAFILNHTKMNADLHRLRQTFVEGEPAALLCVEFAGDRVEDLAPRMDAVEAGLRAQGLSIRCHRAMTAAAQQAVWHVREAALGLSMSMKGDAKALSFVEDAAVAPERLRDYIRELLELVAAHGTEAGVYAHASVGCLHVRPVVDLKTEAGVRTFESIASGVADLVLEYGGALSGEHGDGLVRSPFMARMFGDALYGAFREIKRTFDPDGIFNPGKIVDAPPLTSNLRFGASYRTQSAETHFDYAEHGGFAGAVEMCSGLGACRKTGAGTMCPSFMATREETHSTRGRANALRLALSGKLGEAGLADLAVKEALDLCLECRACKTECPVGVDVGRMKSEHLSAYWTRHGTAVTVADHASADALLFVDTFTNHFHPRIGLSAIDVIRRAGRSVLLAPNVCCGRPLISQGLLAEARDRARDNTRRLHSLAGAGRDLLFLEPSCLSAIREDVPDLLTGLEREQARLVATRSRLFEHWLEGEVQAGRANLPLSSGPSRIIVHGHCHQKSMGDLAPAKALLARVPGATVVEPDAGCCGMAGSFGYMKTHFEVSQAIGERRLLPVARGLAAGDVLVASGTSCRQQIADFTGIRAYHAAELVQNLLTPTR
jgi:Fe-S oxidoreductase